MSVLLATFFLTVHVQAPVDTALYTVLHYKPYMQRMIGESFIKATADTLTASGVNALEVVVDSMYRAFSNDLRKTPKSLRPLTRYRRQYLAIRDGKGRRLLWINFHCTTLTADWKHDVVVVDDGGGCFFRILVDRSKRKVISRSVNGVAMVHLNGGRGFRNV